MPFDTNSLMSFPQWDMVKGSWRVHYKQYWNLGIQCSFTWPMFSFLKFLLPELPKHQKDESKKFQQWFIFLCSRSHATNVQVQLTPKVNVKKRKVAFKVALWPGYRRTVDILTACIWFLTGLGLCLFRWGNDN